MYLLIDNWEGNLWAFPKQHEEEKIKILLLVKGMLQLFSISIWNLVHGWPSILFQNEKEWSLLLETKLGVGKST